LFDVRQHIIGLYGTPVVRQACVVYTADSIRRFDSKTNRTADSIPDSIRTKKISGTDFDWTFFAAENRYKMGML